MSGIVSRRAAGRLAAGLILGSSLSSGAQVPQGTLAVLVEGAQLDLLIDDVPFTLPQSAIVAWVKQSARAVSNYLGGFPVARASIHVTQSNRDRGVGHGTSWGEPHARCRISLGLQATVDDLDRDWVLTHEMFHFAFPSMPEQNSWIEEGLSTYAEPIARAGIGLISPEEVWRDMLRDMPKGLPAQGDQGLDVTHTWGRTYWGGAIFCLLADVGIRQATQNARGLPDALRAINAAGGNITKEWSLPQALKIGDRATGTTVLSGLYAKCGSSFYAIDLPGLWDQLGVRRQGDTVAFDDHAPLAAIRRRILGAPQPRTATNG